MSQSVMLSGQGQSLKRESNASARCLGDARFKMHVVLGSKDSNGGVMGIFCVDANGNVLEYQLPPAPLASQVEAASIAVSPSARGMSVELYVGNQLASRVCLDADGKVIECPPPIAPTDQPAIQLAASSTDNSPCPCVARARERSKRRSRAA